MTIAQRLCAAALVIISAAGLGTSRIVPEQSVMPGVSTESVSLIKQASFPKAPVTAAGFSELFAQLDPREWGGADVSVSVPLPDGRSVWLYGDTFSDGPDGRGRFVHSSAIVQTGAVLHVSLGGAQLLPDDDEQHIYWIENGVVRDARHLVITARSTVLVGTGPWDFEDGGFSRTALVEVTSGGDVVFEKWLATSYCPAPDPGPMYRFDDNPHHIGYARNAHPQFPMASGKVLVTTCQNWDDGRLHPFADYRPIFHEI